MQLGQSPVCEAGVGEGIKGKFPAMRLGLEKELWAKSGCGAGVEEAAMGEAGTGFREWGRELKERRR